MRGLFFPVASVIKRNAHNPDKHLKGAEITLYTKDGYYANETKAP